MNLSEKSILWWCKTLLMFWPHRNVSVWSGGRGGVSVWHSPRQQHKFRLWAGSQFVEEQGEASAAARPQWKVPVFSPRPPVRGACMNGAFGSTAESSRGPWPRGSRMTERNAAWRLACGKDRACCYLQINNIKSGSLSCRQLQERLVHLLSVCCDLTSDLCTDGCFARAETVSSLFLANRCVWWWMVTDFKDYGSVISLVSIRRDSSEVWARFLTLKLKTIKDGRSHCDTFWNLSVHSEMSS